MPLDPGNSTSTDVLPSCCGFVGLLLEAGTLKKIWYRRYCLKIGYLQMNGSSSFSPRRWPQNGGHTLLSDRQRAVSEGCPETVSCACQGGNFTCDTDDDGDGDGTMWYKRVDTNTCAFWEHSRLCWMDLSQSGSRFRRQVRAPGTSACRYRWQGSTNEDQLCLSAKLLSWRNCGLTSLANSFPWL